MDIGRWSKIKFEETLENSIDELIQSLKSSKEKLLFHFNPYIAEI